MKKTVYFCHGHEVVIIISNPELSLSYYMFWNISKAVEAKLTHLDGFDDLSSKINRISVGAGKNFLVLYFKRNFLSFKYEIVNL